MAQRLHGSFDGTWFKAGSRRPVDQFALTARRDLRRRDVIGWCLIFCQRLDWDKNSA